MAQDLLKVEYILEFVLTPWTSWPFQAFPANRFTSFTNNRLLHARNAWGFFEAVEAYDAKRRLTLATQSVIGLAFVTDPNLWYELEIESEYDEYKYGQYLHSVVCPEISWNSQRYLGIPPPGTALTLELLIPYPISITNVIAFAQDKAALVVWPRSTEPVISYTVTSNPGNKSVVAQPGAEAQLMTDLSNGTPYTFTVTVKNSVGLSSTSAPSASVIPRTNPQPPTDISATPGFLSATLTWLGPIDNGGGPITTYTVVSNPGNVIVDVSGLSATVTGLQGRSTYFFTVTATNSFGLDSLPNRSNSITTLSLSDPPSVEVTPGPSSVLVTWTPAPYTGGVPITTYTVMLDPSGQTQTVTDLSASFTGLTNGSSYIASVTTNNQFGSSVQAYSNEFSPLTTPDPPASVTAAFQSVIVASWSASNPQGSPIISYTVNLLDPSSNILETKVVSSLSTIFSTYAYGIEYRVSVSARNAIGTSAATISGSVVPITRPSVPTDLSVQISDSSATLLWTAPFNGGTPITEYRVSLQPGSQTQTVTDLSATFTGLSYGVTYTMSVIAVNSVGPSPAAISNTFIPTATPDPPASVTASFQSVIDARWPASNPRGTPVTSYSVSLLDPSSTIVETKTVTTLSTFFSTFTYGSAYRVSVSATNAVGTSAATISGSVVPIIRPSAPADLSVQVSDSSATLLWNAPFDGGTPITGYRVSLRPGLSLQAQTITQQTASFTGLTNGTIYEFTVVAINTVGTSGPSSILGIPYGLPSVPIGVQATPSAGSVKVTWFPPAYTGGYPLTSYTVSGHDASGSQLSTVTVPIYSPLAVTYSDLSNGTLYSFTVTVFTSKGSSSSTVTAMPLSVPDPPIDVSGVNVADSIVLTWKPPVRNGGAPILDYMVSISPGYSIIYTSDLTATFSDLISGTMYTFTISAINIIGPSVSTQFTMMHITPPSVPRSVSLTMGAKNALMAWSPPISNGGSPLTSYTVNVLDPSGALVSSYSDLSASVLFTGLSDNTVYSFTIFCSNAFGSSASQTFSGITADFPSVPRNITATAGIGLINLAWSAPSSNGRMPILSYSVTTFDSSGSLVSTNSVTGLSYQATGLTNGILYTFNIAAVNAVGPGLPGTIQARPIGPPSPPQGLTITAVKGSLTVRWSPPVSNGGLPITNYTITTNAAPVRTVTDLSATYTGLTNGTTYSFSIVVSNGILTSTAATINGVPGAVPSIPLSLATTRSDGTIGLSWSIPSDTGGLPILSYTIVGADSSGNTVAIPSITINSTGGSVSFTGLINGRTYTFTVAANNAKGSGPSATISDTPGAPPSAPTSLTATASSGSILLNWSPPSNLGGFPITSYTAAYGGATITGLTGLTYTFTGLINGTTYIFTVTATNARGTSAAASISGLPLGPPSIPLNLTAAGGNASLFVSWSTPSSNGGAPITSYVAIVTNTSTGVVVPNPTINITGSGGSATYTGLTNGTMYSVSVAAVAASTGPPATTTSLAGTVPGSPVSLSQISGSSLVTVSWAAPLDNGGSAITSYRITVLGTTYPNVTSPYTITGLTNGVMYSINISALNIFGASIPAVINGTAIGTPSIPTSLVGTPGDTTVTLSWNSPADNGGFSIANYYINYTNPSTSVTSNIDVGANTSTLITGLTNGTSIVFTVTASNGILTGPGAVVTVTPAPATTVPGQPGWYNGGGSSITGTPGLLYVYDYYREAAYNLQQQFFLPNSTNLLSGTPTGELGALILWYASANGGLPIDYYNLSMSAYESVFLSTNIAALPVETAGVTVYAFWTINRAYYTPVTISVYAHNALGNSIPLSIISFFYP